MGAAFAVVAGALTLFLKRSAPEEGEAAGPDAVPADIAEERVLPVR